MGIVSAMMQVGAAIKHAVAALFKVTHSLRFDGSADYLEWSGTPESNRKTNTFSFWFKPMENAVNNAIFFQQRNTGSTKDLQFIIQMRVVSGRNSLRIMGQDNSATDILLDSGADVDFEAGTWYHLVVAVNTNEGTSTNRVKVWIDGQQYTNWSSPSWPSSGYSTGINRASTRVLIGVQRPNTSSTLNSYSNVQLAEYHFIDGQALDASYFGETNTSGQWVPKEVTGVTYGNNGFHLPFSTPSSEINAFNAVTWTADGVINSVDIEGVGFQPDLVWQKSYDAGYVHHWHDSIMGINNRLQPDDTNAMTYQADTLTSFNADGFTLGDTSNGNYQTTTASHVGWCWKAGGAPTATNTSGTAGAPGQTPTSGSVMIDGAASTAQLPSAPTNETIIYPTKMSVNTETGFSIVQYTGTAANTTVPHGLSQTPECIIVKNTDDGTTNWLVYHEYMDANPEQKRIFLNLADAKTDSTTPWNDTAPTSSLITLGTSGYTNGNNQNMIAYCWHSVPGYSKIGNFTGSGATGKKVTTGFKPAFVMVKNVDTDFKGWAIYDNARFPDDTAEYHLAADSYAAEGTTSYTVRFDADGFTIVGSANFNNQSGNNLIYMAFADTSPNLGLDATTNTNNFAVNGAITPDDQLIDSPNLRFATLDPATASASASVLSNANLTQNIGTTVGATLSDASFSAGKYYAEVRIDSMGNPANAWVGVSGNSNTAWDGGYYWGASAGVGTGRQYSASSNDTFGSNPAVGDIIQIAVDRDNGKIWWGLNGAWQQNGGTSPNPATGTDAAYTDASGPLGTQALRFGGQDGSGSDVNTELTWNFGQDHTFSGTLAPLSSPYDDGDNGEFRYQPPSGFKALATSY